MNTKEELKQAFKDIEDGTFIKEHLANGTLSDTQVNKSYYK